jgi:hypothetical protein
MGLSSRFGGDSRGRITQNCLLSARFWCAERAFGSRTTLSGGGWGSDAGVAEPRAARQAAAWVGRACGRTRRLQTIGRLTRASAPLGGGEGRPGGRHRLHNIRLAKSRIHPPNEEESRKSSRCHRHTTKDYPPGFSRPRAVPGSTAMTCSREQRRATSARTV